MVEVIILAGGDISRKIPFLELRSKCPALIPVNTKPLASYVIEFYQSHKNTNIHLFVSKEYIDEVKKELSYDKKSFNIHPLPKTKGVVESLSKALDKINSNDEVIINLVTTIPTKFPEKNEIQISKNNTNYELGARVCIDNKKILFISKREKNSKSGYPFTGIIRAKHKLLKKATSSTIIIDDLLDTVKNIYPLDKFSFCKTEWIDCGHEINFFEAKTKLLQSRIFNQIEISPIEGILRKKSSNHEKLEKEANYLEKLPSDIKIFFPRLISKFQKQNYQAFFEIEYYGYPNVAEYLLYWNLGKGHWQRIFSRFKFIFNCFSKYRSSIDLDSFEKFYIGKTEKRVNNFFEQMEKRGEDDSWTKKEITINGKKCSPLEKLWPKIKEKIRDIYSEKDFCIMHGDFCFNNLLYDVPSGIVRLIDQRGSFGEDMEGIYGDQKYDLAKLAHSTIGNYDYLVNGLFSLSQNKEQNKFDYEFNLRDNHKLVSDLCEKLIKELGYKKTDILFIMGLLFISMCPIHYDSYKKQKTMFIHGLKILNEVLIDG